MIAQKVSQKLPNKNWKKIVDQLVIESCLAFGDNSKYTQKKVARYLLGTRATFEIFKLYELRYLLLKVYPFIQNLFYNPRLNSTLKTKKLWNQNYQKQLETQRKLGTRLPSNEWKPRVRFINSFVQKKKNLTPQVLFATVTPNYTEIIKAAAQICNMPSHENRWLNGSITAAISYQEDHAQWNYITDEIQAQTLFNFTKKWGSNKENSEKTKEKVKYYGESRWPSLIIIPDLSNNIMILKEAKKVGLPVMGLVNSSTPFQIDYPIFAQEQTIQSVHFFCHFLATLIAKEMVYIQHKRYILQKKKRKLKKKSVELKRTNFTQSKTWHAPFFKKNVFFRLVKPVNDRKILTKVWFTEYRLLKSKGPYYQPKWKYGGRNTFKNRLRLKKRFISNISTVLKKKRTGKLGKAKKKRLCSKFFVHTKKYKQKGKKFLNKKLNFNSTRYEIMSDFAKKPKKYFRHLEQHKFLKIIRRFLKKKKKIVKIITKQKYLRFLLNLRKKMIVRPGLNVKFQFLQENSLKKNQSLTVLEQKQLWKKIHAFLNWEKISNIQKKNKILRFQKAKSHTGYKNYYGEALKQWKQTVQFQSPRHSLGIIFTHIPYRVRLAKAQYYDAHPAEWKAEKARIYKILTYSKYFKKRENPQQRENYKNQHPNEKQKNNWAQFTENHKPQGVSNKTKNKNYSDSRKKKKLKKKTKCLNLSPRKKNWTNTKVDQKKLFTNQL